MLRPIRSSVFLLAFFAAGGAAAIQPLPRLVPVPSTLHIESPAVPRLPWAVTGEHGALFGTEDGVFEAWLWPVKILSQFHISAELANYPVPIDVNRLASSIQVTPAETTITYSHAAFTIRQHMFTPRGAAQPVTGAVVFFDIQSARPLTITFSFTPDVQRMWPAPNFGRPSAEWVKQGASGFYILHTDNPHFSAIVGMPHTQPGIMVPYQEHPQVYPLQLKLSFDPKRDRGLEFPLIMHME
ncbi:MAG: glycogen debranching protein, partial [Bryobacteraceae bacterium]